jgi:hypothetical protein
MRLPLRSFYGFGFLAGVCPVRIAFIGVNDRFAQSGEPQELIDHYGMGVDSIIDAMRKIRSNDNLRFFSQPPLTIWRIRYACSLLAQTQFESML